MQRRQTQEKGMLDMSMFSTRKHSWIAAALPTLLMLAAILIVGAALSGCIEYNGATVRVTEVEKERTHEFRMVSDGQRTLLEGAFSIDGKSYPGEIYYDGKNSYILRKNPNQCISYDIPDKLLFGFRPIPAPAEEAASGVTVLEKDSKDRPIMYKLVDQGMTSIVEINGIDQATDAGKGFDFKTIDTGTCINEGEVYTIG
ncbi:MAG: hypothetical protein V1743_07165 [Nanoarchaeota archaeon]